MAYVIYYVQGMSSSPIRHGILLTLLDPSDAEKVKSDFFCVPHKASPTVRQPCVHDHAGTLSQTWPRLRLRSFPCPGAGLRGRSPALLVCPPLLPVRNTNRSSHLGDAPLPRNLSSYDFRTCDRRTSRVSALTCRISILRTVTMTGSEPLTLTTLVILIVGRGRRS